MADETPQQIPPRIPANLGKFVLEPLSHALAAGEREALRLGVEAQDVIEMILNHLASVVALIEPPGVRADAIASCVKFIPELTRKYVEKRHMSPGGVYMPGYTTDVVNAPTAE